jgi:hypothetical protein
MGPTRMVEEGGPTLSGASRLSSQPPTASRRPQNPPVDADRPTWQLVLEAAAKLSASQPSGFRLADLIAEVQRREPDRDRISIQPVVQGMTIGAGKGPRSPCGRVLLRLEPGSYLLPDTATLIAPPSGAQTKSTRRTSLLTQEELPPDESRRFRDEEDLDMNIGDAAFDPTTFSKNRERLLDHEVAHRFFNAVRAEAERRQLLSDDHFTVDGTLLEAWASLKSVRPKDDDSAPPRGRNPEVDFHGQRRRNDTHQSTTDPEARLAKKSHGTAAKPSYAGHLLMENRNGLVVDAALTPANGYAERDTALGLLHRRRAERQTRQRWTGAATRATTPRISWPDAAPCR